jgi:drug/metabolite transporter (DMT)-like permease
VSVPIAYLGVIVIWATTPLAIQWSGEGGGFLFGITARMVIGAPLAALALALLRRGLPLHRIARQTYLAAGLGIYGAMLCVYWASQQIPSGWLSVIFGLAPIVTGIMARAWLDERAFSPTRLVGMFLGIGGLVVIFRASLGLGPNAAYGILAMIAAVSLHSASAVWVKRLNPGLPGLAVTTGGLLVAAPLLLITWLTVDGQLPAELPLRAALSIGYLAACGSVLGFSLYFYVLHHMEASRVALITLVTPVIALMLGHLLNSEPLSSSAFIGAGLILAGLGLYQWGARLWKRGLA